MSYTKSRRRRYQDDDDFSVWKAALGLVILYALYVAYLWNTNRAAYWWQLVYFVIFLVVIFGGSLLWSALRAKWKREKIEGLVAALQGTGAEDYLKNFINQFGLDRKKGKVWSYRNYTFEWDRLRDLRKFLIEKGMPIRQDEWNDLSLLLRYYIQEKEERFTRDSIAADQGDKLANLSGSDFEKLLYRLFEAMGYSVQRTGKVGDQGADLVVNMNNERVVVQAKRYSANVGNAAVQEAATAQKFYGCTKAMVVTTSGFTKEAFDLAKANGVELIGRDRLSQLLLQYLKESWS